MSDPPTDRRVPEACAVAFKEWAGVCLALEDGRQTVLLRKGGIAEDSGGFVPEHRAFWMFPTRLHEAQQGLRPPLPPPLATGPQGTVDLRLLAVVDSIWWIDSERALRHLEGFHAWTPETVLKKFSYRTPGLWVLGVRVYVRDRPARIVVTPDQDGCKSWLTLGRALPATELVPVLTDDEAEGRARALDEARTLSEGAGHG